MGDFIELSHPQFIRNQQFFTQMRDTYAGEKQVKDKGVLYLPHTDNQEEQILSKDKAISEIGKKRYSKYKNRSIFPEYVSSTITAMLGLMYQNSPTKIELPKAMAEMIENCTPTSDSIEMLMRRTNEEQFIVGRRGLLLEPTRAGDTPKILEYYAENIINWNSYIDENGESVYNMILIDESGFTLQGIEWKYLQKLRLLALDGEGYYYTMEIPEDFEFSEFDIKHPPEQAVYPAIREKRLNKIPFVFINANSNIAEIEKPPLMALSNMALAIYRGEADYRQHLYQQAQDTLFIKGIDTDDSEIKLGTGAYISTTSEKADAKFIGVNSQGLPEERQSLTNLHSKAQAMGISFIENENSESGEALKTRLTVKTASMKTIAMTGAGAIENLFKICAEWIGANPEEVIIKPNLDYSNSTVAATELVQLWNGKQTGLPISEKSIHDYMRTNGFTSMAYEDEKDVIDEEQGLVL